MVAFSHFSPPAVVHMRVAVPSHPGRDEDARLAIARLTLPAAVLTRLLRLTRLCMVWFAVLLSPGAMAADILDVLKSRASAQQIYDNLRGEVLIDLRDELFDTADSRFVAVILTPAAEECGLRLRFDFNDPDRIVWLHTVSDPSTTSVAAAFAAIPLDYGLTVHPSREDVEHMSRELTARGFSSVELTKTAAGFDLLIYLVDRNAVDTSMKSSAPSFLVFNGIAGLNPQPERNTNNQFSYIFDGGNLRDLSGADADRSGRLCHASALVHRLCKGKSLEMAALALPSIETACSADGGFTEDLRRTNELYRDLERQHRQNNGGADGGRTLGYDGDANRLPMTSSWQRICD